MNKLLIVLDKYLKIWVDSGDGLKLLVHELPDGKYLNLSDSYEYLWSDIDSEYDMSGGETAYIVGPHAGFTDTRVVYLWLRSAEQVDGLEYKLMRVKESEELDTLGSNDEQEDALQKMYKKVITDGQKDLEYSKEANIGGG